MGRADPITDSSSAEAFRALQQLKRVMLATFNEADVLELCDDMSINIAEIPNNTSRELILGVIEWVHRRGRLTELVAAVKLRRPNAQW